jgi:hypothetical protein
MSWRNVAKAVEMPMSTVIAFIRAHDSPLFEATKPATSAIAKLQATLAIKAEEPLFKGRQNRCACRDAL